MKVALIVATPGEAAFFAGVPFPAFVCGIGAVNAALTTADVLRAEQPDLVVSAGIGGAYPGSGLQPGDVVIASDIIYGGLGAMDGEAFLDLKALGFPLLPGLHNHLPAWNGSREWARLAGAACGPVLTLDTVTGSEAVALRLRRHFPGALVEAMEGAGVAHAARRAGVPAAEVRGVSNHVGPRDRDAWRIREALDGVARALRALPAADRH